MMYRTRRGTLRTLPDIAIDTVPHGGNGTTGARRRPDAVPLKAAASDEGVAGILVQGGDTPSITHAEVDAWAAAAAAAQGWPRSADGTV
jgi:hypothetical protein